MKEDPSSAELAVVIGANGAIGGAVGRALEARGKRVIGLRRADLDLTDEDSIRDAAARVAQAGTPRLLFVATGMLHEDGLMPEKGWRALDATALARSFAINSIGPALVAKHFLPLLPRAGRSVFAALSARVGSISDNRLGGWYGYRAAKAALNQLIRTLALELARSRPEAICVALHPGTVDSRLSQPFQRAVPQGRLFTPDHSAGRLLAVLDQLTPEDSGRLFAWDGQPIPF